MIYCLTGLLTVTHTQPSKHLAPVQWPLTFKAHDFAAHCYNTRRCSVIYDANNFTRPYLDQPSPYPPSPNYREEWAAASYIGISNFPPPAEVKWTSLDGMEHEAQVDIGAIFEKGLILHKVARDDIPEGWVRDIRPNIYIEVNDRTISVLMRAHIATKEPQAPGNPYSDFRDDTILAWSKTY